MSVGSWSSRRRKLSSTRIARRWTEAARQLRGAHRARQLQQRERVAARLGDEPLADVLVEPAGDDRGQQRARVLVVEPVELQLGQARNAGAGSRTANTIATGSASSRRATNPSTCAEASSSHCRSSTTHSSGCVSATSASSVSAARPTRKRSGAAPAVRPNATSQRLLLRRGQHVEAVEQRPAELVQPRERQLHLGLDARDLQRPGSRRPGRWRGAAARVLPTPASPRSTSTPLLDARASASSRSSACRSLERPRNAGERGAAAAMAPQTYRLPQDQGLPRARPGRERGNLCSSTTSHRRPR